MRFDTLNAWLQWLESQHHQEIELGLQRVSEVARRLDLLHCDAKLITVAGTNGKGSFVAAMQGLLVDQGLRVGSYTSPHILQFNERITVNMQPASDAIIMQAFEAIDQARLHQGDAISLSYFEVATLAALYVFKLQELDYILLEVGLGGRLDAVNIIEPDWAVLTSIGLDHQDFLGDDINTIASEKLGILRANTPLLNLCDLDLPAINQAKLQRPLLQIGSDFDISWQGQSWQLDDKKHSSHYTDIVDNGLSIISQGGAAVLLQHLLGKALTPEQLHSSFAKLSLDGRFQRFEKNGVQIFLDVAHNPQAVSLLAQRLEQYPLAAGKKRFAVFTLFSNKDADGIISEIKDQLSAWFIAESNNSRSFKAHELSAKLHEQGIHMISVSKNLRQAFARASQLCHEGDQILIFGSFQVASELLPKLRKL